MAPHMGWVRQGRSGTNNAQGPNESCAEATRNNRSSTMAIAKVIEIIASSPKGIEDAIRNGVTKAAETVSGIEGAWVKDTKMVIKKNKITEWRVVLAITFLVR
jgi:flavin-binding protein dodecin